MKRPVGVIERSTISKGIAYMNDPCPGCGELVRGEQQVARRYPPNTWWHAACFDEAVE